MALLWSEVRWAAFAGFGVLIMLVPLQAGISRLAASLRRRQLSFTERRVQTLGEALTLMRGLVLSSWDKEVLHEIQRLRVRELRFIVRMALLKGANAALLFTTPVIVTLATFLSYTQLNSDGSLTVASVYRTLAYFSLLRWPMIMIRQVVSAIADASVALDRVESFLLAPEHPGVAATARDACSAVVAARADFGWLVASPPIRDLSLEIRTASLTIVLGAVGSGKSTLLLGIAGECPMLRGTLSRSPFPALLSSHPWLLNASVRENIVAGREFDAAWYAAVLEACALSADVRKWP